MKKKVLRITTVPISLKLLLEGQLKMLNNYYDIVAVSAYGKELEEVKDREKIRTVGIYIERRFTPFKDVKSLFALIRLIYKEKPWMVHTMTPKAGLLGMIAAWVCMVPVRMHTFTGLIFPASKGIKRVLLKTTDKITCACATIINPEGNGVKNDLLKNNITNIDKLYVIGNGNVNGIDVSYFNRTESVLRKAKNIRKKKYTTFCFIGRIVGDKGINELIEAFIKLTNEFTKCRLIMVGDFEDKIDPIKPTNKKIIFENQQIIFTGWQDDIRPFLAASDIFVFPSYREGFPNVVLQAGAMGLPCIVTDINGCNEIIHNKVNGLIIPSKNTNALLNAMRYMYLNKKERINMGHKSRELIINRYNRPYVWNELKKLYHNLET